MVEYHLLIFLKIPYSTRYNHLTTYKTFEYMFDKLKKGVYIVIQNGRLVKYLLSVLHIILIIGQIS